jgi:hypothetical protein
VESCFILPGQTRLTCRISEVIRAATHLGVDSDEIDDMQIWKGDEELGEVKLDERGEWVSKFAAPGEKMDGVEEQLEQEPGLGIKEIYEEATPYILRLQVNTDDKNAIAELQNLNSRIREKNQSYGDEGKKANRFLINHETLVANYKMASSSILSLLNHPMEAKARKHFDDLNTNLKAFCKKNHYPQDWVMISPPNGYQYRVQKEATPYMRILIRNVDDADALAGLAKSNELIVQHNKERNLPEDQWNNGTICGDFISIFESAAPFIDRLAKNNADGEAKTRFDELNEQLRLVNTLYHYPSDWVMTTLLNQSEVPPALPNPIIIGDSETSQSGPIPNTIIIGDSETSQSGPIPRAMIIGGEKPGWVFDQGIDKEINACFKVGSGHRLLFCKPGRNGFPISELVAASTFGKGVVKSYLEVEGSKEVTISDKNALKKMKGQKMYISAVASVRRYLENEPKNGWKTKPVTFARLTPFGSKPSLDNPWFARSTLAQEWGQKPADTMLTAFRNYVGQEDYEYTEDEPSETDAWSEKEDAQRAWKAGSVLRNETDIAKIERLKTELAMLLKTAATQISAKGNRQPATNDDEV